MTPPLSEWTCYHCGQRCGGRLETGYAALPGEFTPDGAIHASCSPAEPGELPQCYLRVLVYKEPAGALRDVRPLPAGVKDIRTAV